jgi:hypothetical protein
MCKSLVPPSPNLNDFKTGQETILSWNGSRNLGTAVQNETLEISQESPFVRQGAREVGPSKFEFEELVQLA